MNPLRTAGHGAAGPSAPTRRPLCTNAPVNPAVAGLAGLAGMSTALFVATGAAGRFARFTVLAASPALVAGWLQ